MVIETQVEEDAPALYDERLISHFRNPRNTGELESPAVTVEVSNPACGDVLRLSVLFENGRIRNAAYKTRGCTASIAAGSVLTELVSGKTPAELRTLNAGIIEEALGGLPAESKHAATLCMDAVNAILKAI